jgi:hypothetical protein
MRLIQPSRGKSLDTEGIKIIPLADVGKRAMVLRVMLIQKPLNPVWILDPEGHVDSRLPTPTNGEWVRNLRD